MRFKISRIARRFSAGFPASSPNLVPPGRKNPPFVPHWHRRPHRETHVGSRQRHPHEFALSDSKNDGQMLVILKPNMILKALLNNSLPSNPSPRRLIPMSHGGTHSPAKPASPSAMCHTVIIASDSPPPDPQSAQRQATVVRTNRHFLSRIVTRSYPRRNRIPVPLLRPSPHFWRIRR